MSDQIFGLIIPGMSVLFAVAAFALWLGDRQRRYLLSFVVASLAIGTSLTINHYSGAMGTPIARAAAHLVSMTAIIAMVWGVCARSGGEVPLRIWLALALGVVVVDLIPTPRDNFMATFFLVNSACGIIYIMAVQHLVQAGSRQFFDRLLIWVFTIVAIQFFVRPTAVIMIEGPLTAEQYRESGGHALLIVSAVLLTLLQAAAVIGMIMYDRLCDIRDSSLRDPLTGLLARRAFEDEADLLLNESRNEAIPLSLIVADIDHFKQVNDLWGHQAGDKAIAGFGRLITATIRQTDRAGRIGGEEFCVLVWNCNEQQAEGLARRLCQSFATMQHEGINDDIRLTSSFGVAAARAGETYERLFARADAALYYAKETGRNRVASAERKRRGNAATDRKPEPLELKRAASHR